MQQRSLGPFTVSAIGLGCMNFCHAYGAPVSEAQAQRVLLASLDAGVTHFDTATLYGFGQSELLLGKYLAPHRKRFTLASKCGMHAAIGPDGKKVRAIDGRPATLRQNCEDSLKRLRTDVIDLYYLHRWDKAVPIEESVGLWIPSKVTWPPCRRRHCLLEIDKPNKIREFLFRAYADWCGVSHNLFP